MRSSRRAFLLTLSVATAMAWPNFVSAESKSPAWPSRTLQLHADKAETYPPVVTSAKLHPAGELLATAGDDHSIAVWNVADGHVRQTLSGHLDCVRTLAFSQDGTVLASSGNDRRILFWDATTGERTRDFASLPFAVASLEFNPDATLLAVAGFSKSALLLDVATGHVHAELEGPDGDLRVVAFSPDGKTLAAAGRSGKIRMWNIERRELIREVAAHTQRVRALTFTPDGAALISGGEDRLVQITPVSPGAPSIPLPRQTGQVFSLALCKDHKLAVAGSDNLIRLWDLRTRELVGTLGVHQGTVATLESRGDLLVSGGFDTTVRIWTIADRVAARPGTRLE